MRTCGRKKIKQKNNTKPNCIYGWNILYHKNKIKSKHFFKNTVVKIVVGHWRITEQNCSVSEKNLKLWKMSNCFIKGIQKKL